MIITTTNNIQGKNIKKYLGVVNTNFVLGTNFLSEIKVGFSDFFGGTSGTYKNKLNIIYEKAIKELTDKAYSLHADAIVGLAVDFDEISGGGVSMLMVSATGTAVSFWDKLDARFAMYKQMSDIHDYKQKGFISQEEYEYEIKRVKSIYLNGLESEMNTITEERIQDEARQKEEEYQRIQSLKTTDEIVKDKFSILKGDLASDIDIESIKQATYSDVEYDDTEPIAYIVSRFLRLKRYPEACKIYMDKTNITDISTALDFCLNVRKNISQVNETDLLNLTNKLKVLKKRGYIEQAISEYQKLTCADKITAKEFIDNLS